MSITRLVEQAVIPRIYKVRQDFADDSITDAAAAVRETMEASGLERALPKGGEIAVAVGSRGIAQLPAMVRAVVAWFKEKNARPFIVPSMGSHGGATAEGQVKVLADLGITEESAGCAIRSGMDTVQFGILENGLPVHLDAIAASAAGIFVINRVKPHTTFTAKHESGLVKMLSIGLGKQRGAEACHSLGFAHFPAVMPRMAEMIFAKTPVLGGLAIVENAYDRPCRVEAVPRGTFLERDAALLQYAKERMPSLPLAEADILLIHRMGKNISGSGMDPNITGRAPSPYKTASFAATKAGVLRLTDESKGNASGLGLADVIPDALLRSVNFEYTYANLITSTMLRAGFVPVVMPHDKAVLQCLIQTCNAVNREPRLVYIRDTLTLDRFWASKPVADELASRPGCRVDPVAGQFVFDGNGTLTAPGWE